MGLFLALPLTVVGQVWFKEAVIKDVLDRWQKQKDSEQEKTQLTESDNAEDSLDNSSLEFTQINADNDLRQDEHSPPDNQNQSQGKSAETQSQTQVDSQ